MATRSTGKQRMDGFVPTSGEHAEWSASLHRSGFSVDMTINCRCRKDVRFKHMAFILQQWQMVLKSRQRQEAQGSQQGM